jgi:hypothetical protein
MIPSYGNVVHVEGYDRLHTIGSRNEKEAHVRNPITKREFWIPLTAIRAYQPSDPPIESADALLSEREPLPPEKVHITVKPGKISIRHSKFGNGEILKINGDTVCCKFPDAGRVNLSAETIPRLEKMTAEKTAKTDSRKDGKKRRKMNTGAISLLPMNEFDISTLRRLKQERLSPKQASGGERSPVRLQPLDGKHVKAYPLGDITKCVFKTIPGIATTVAGLNSLTEITGDEDCCWGDSILLGALISFLGKAPTAKKVLFRTWAKHEPILKWERTADIAEDALNLREDLNLGFATVFAADYSDSILLGTYSDSKEPEPSYAFHYEAELLDGKQISGDIINIIESVTGWYSYFDGSGDIARIQFVEIFTGKEFSPEELEDFIQDLERAKAPLPEASE